MPFILVSFSLIPNYDMKKIILLLLNICLLSSFSYSAGKFALGVNLDENGAFVNIVNQTNRYSGAVGFDSLGWAVSDFDLVLLDGRPATEWNGTIDDPEQYRIDYSGRYKSSFKGTAQLRATGTSVAVENQIWDPVSNTTFFDIVISGYPESNHGLVFLKFTNTRRTANDTLKSGITELKVNRPGYPVSTNKIFTDEYINLCKSADFACYRFYNVQNIWDGEPTYPAKKTWNSRKTPYDACQHSMSNINGKSDGWCWEYVTELANLLNKDIWLNVYMSADSDYVANLAKFLKFRLNPEINIYIENSNEVWSPTQATHGPYNKAEADYYKISFDQNYARRTVELSKWFAKAFGADEMNKRIRIILAGQHAYNGRSDTHLNYIKSAFGEPRDFIYATSSALYFGSSKASATDPKVINDGMTEDINSQITDSQVGTYRLNHINKANQWGFAGGCTSYEGGPSIPEGGATANLGNQILANRTEKMKDVVKLNYLEGWKNIGGGLAMYFTLTSGYNRYGCWGITDDYTKPDRNYKMQAVRNIIAESTSSVDGSDEDNLLIYPNPVQDELTLTEDASEIAIYDVLGREVFSKTITLGEKIKLFSLQSGTYFVKINNKIRIMTKI